jgi:CDP-diacylglycerol pyrophosphatase
MQSKDKSKINDRLPIIALILIGLLVVGSGRTPASAQDLTFQENSPTSLEEPGVSPASPDPLWVAVSTCIQTAITSNSFGPAPNPAHPPVPPCIYVFRPMDATPQIGQGFSVLKDTNPSKTFGFLTVASKIVSGIDDPQVNFFAGQPPSSYSRNYWASAWSALDYTVNKMYQQSHQQKALGVGQMGLAINSVMGRTLNQFHIHMSCINKEVRDTLASNMAKITTKKWTKIPIPNKQTYSVTLLTDLTTNPFLIMRTVPGYTAPGLETLVVTGKPGTTNFYLLEDYTHGADIGAGEELLDQKCATWP